MAGTGPYFPGPVSGHSGQAGDMGVEMRGKIISRDFVIGILLFVVCLLTYFAVIPRQIEGEIQRGQ